VTSAQKVKSVAENAWVTFFGRGMQLIGTPLMVALILAVLHKIDNFGHRIDVLEDKMSVAYADPYHATDAKRDFEWRDRNAAGIESHVENLDGRVQALELANARGRK